MQYCFVSYNPLHNVTNRDVATLINNHVYIRGTRSYIYRVVAPLHSFLNPFSLCACYPSISTYGLHALTDYWTFTGIPIALASPRNDIHSSRTFSVFLSRSTKKKKKTVISSSDAYRARYRGVYATQKDFSLPSSPVFTAGYYRSRKILVRNVTFHDSVTLSTHHFSSHLSYCSRR